MKGFIAIALCSTCVPVWAADLPVKARPVVPDAAAYGDPWTGFYLGAHVGYGWDTGGANAGFTEPVFFNSIDTSVPRGVVGGIHAGYGQRFANIFYVGLEGDADVSGISAGGTGQMTAVGKNTWLASARARLGVIPVGHAMFYGTAGWGWGGGELTIADPAGSSSISPTMNGFVWGGGLEIPLAQNWLARVEYLRYDFGSATVVGSLASFTVNDRVEVVRGGLSYKF
jgi:outer membrane immunogenic protein